MTLEPGVQVIASRTGVALDPGQIVQLFPAKGLAVIESGSGRCMVRVYVKRSYATALFLEVPKNMRPHRSEREAIFERDAYLAALAERGLSVAQIADEIGMHRGSVAKAIRRTGMAGHMERAKEHAEARAEVIRIAFRETSLSYVEIGKRLGVSEAVVCAALKGMDRSAVVERQRRNPARVRAWKDASKGRRRDAKGRLLPGKPLNQNGVSP